ncbi:sensor histidine kinase [Microbacterium endophyticum]|nr:HAMP domain-containing sensor histidine kinase [Microbacterium endophyticum]
MLGRLSIRARITIGTLLIAALFFTGVAIVVRQQVDGILQNAAYDVLMSDATPFETAIQQEPDDPVDNPGEGQLIAVVDPTGATRVSTLPSALTATPDLVDVTRPGPQHLVVDGSAYLVAVEKVTSPGGDWTIISARNENASRQVLEDLTVGLIIGLGTLTVLFGLVSWLLTGAALRPVSHLRRSADTIVATSSDELLPVGPAKDEITYLATTLNTLITDLRASATRERQMVSDASHELRTPLAVLQTQLELLRTGDRSTLDADLVAAGSATLRLNQLVDSLLELSRLDSGRATTTATLGELIDEAGEAVDRARSVAGSDRIDIDLDVTGSIDRARTLPMAALLYGRVLDNLVANAVRAVDGHGRILVTLTATNDRLETTVADSGPGMQPAFVPYAFDRFTQEDRSRAAGHGSGLGLAIVAAAVSAAGGSAHLTNVPGRGLTVTVRLPNSAETIGPLKSGH